MNCSIIASVYNEEAGIKMFYEKTSSVLESLSIDYEIIFVNDGSKDRSLQILENIAQSDKHVKIISFSRNFGHESAMIAGIDNSLGNTVICMDSDLQHSPELIPEMLKKQAEGFDIINMVRTLRKDAGFFSRLNSKLFYKFLNSISSIKLEENASDFFLISKNVADILKTDFRERTRFLRGLIQLVGFNKTTIQYTAPKRVAGKSHYSFVKLLKLSITAVSSFSKVPLQLGIICGLFFVIFSLIVLIFSVIMWLLGDPFSGYTTLIVFLSLFAGIQMFVIGIIGQYLSFMFDELKQRPIYIVEKKINFQ